MEEVGPLAKTLRMAAKSILCYNMTMPSHRHFVALPIVVLCFSLVFGLNQALVPAHAGAVSMGLANEVIVPGSQQSVVRTPVPGMIIIAESDTDAQFVADEMMLQLTRGSILIRTDSVVRGQLGERQYAGLLGSFALSSDEAGSTLVAIDTLILLKDSMGQMILSPGFQAYIAHGTSPADDPVISSVPATWMADKLAVLSDAETQASPDHSAASTLNKRELSLDLQGEILSADQLGRALGTVGRVDPALKRILALRLSADPRVAREDTVLAAELSRGEFAADTARTIVNLAASGRLLPDAVVKAWGVLSEHSALQSPAVTLSLLLPRASAFPSAFEEQGFPLHAQLWQQVIGHLLTFTESLLSAEDARALQPLIHETERSLIGIRTDQIADSSSESSTVSSASPYAGDATADAHAVLTQRGAMVGPATAFRSLSPTSSSVRITDIYFATKSGDHAFSFTLDLTKKTVSDIEQNGERLPNALRLEQFLNSM